MIFDDFQNASPFDLADPEQGWLSVLQSQRQLGDAAAAYSGLAYGSKIIKILNFQNAWTDCLWFHWCSRCCICHICSIYYRTDVATGGRKLFEVTTSTAATGANSFVHHECSPKTAPIVDSRILSERCLCLTFPSGHGSLIHSLCIPGPCRSSHCFARTLYRNS